MRASPPLLSLMMLATLASCIGGRESRRVELGEEESYVVAEGRWRVAAGVAEAVARERPDLPLHELTLRDVEGAPVVSIPSLRPPQMNPAPNEGIAYFEVALDEQLNAECVVRSSRLDLAQAFHRAHKELASRPALERRHFPEPALHHGPDGWPLVMLRLEYLTPDRAYGTLRMAATNVNDRGVFCTADSPGYARTFEHVVDTLVQSLARGAADPAQRRSFHAIKLNGAVAGLAEDMTKQRDDGSLVDMSFVALLLPRGDELRAVDEVSVEVTAPDGELVTLRVMQQVDGVMTRDVSISGGRHATLEDRLGDARADLGSVPPASGRALRTHYQDVMQRGGGPPRVFLRYYPGLDGAGLTEETVELKGQEGGAAHFSSVIRSPREVVQSSYDIGADGERLRGMVTWGASTLTLERVLPLP
ncbi:MAG: hypothetical protein AB2A00_41510 [Myxococcota bacterium]